VRDYDKNPIVIKNSYLFKWNLTIFVCLSCTVLFFIVGDYFIAIPKSIAENDMFSLRRQRSMMISAIVGLLVAYIWAYREYRYYFKYQLFIKIYNNKITYDYISNKGHELKTFTLLKTDIKYIKWGFFPYLNLNKNNKDKIWMMEWTNDKLGSYLLSPVVFAVSCIYQLLYFLVNFKIEKYVLIRFKGGIMAIPKNEYPSNENIKFEWRSLFNIYVFTGGIVNE
jgi:hypothetical protein